MGQYWDPAGEYEFHNTVYTLAVYVPPRPPSKYLPGFLTPDRPTPNINEFNKPEDLVCMDTKTTTIKAHRFPVDLRCKHVQEKTRCAEGCYVLEKGGKDCKWTCRSVECEGHVYGESQAVGAVKETGEGSACFGKKGERLVCLKSA
ncbi:hypothetical protein BU23DRAFT_626071 [Bimuria novae-zelandiae CBS 107.79]|uniref:Uncharacterized protein n=1 Tax=Bimuria novae-zelandiae CBS 107.79 TaxID=1447943 RepID=A0A6A5VUT7_9PLEO|nr:hypothetical protein BU23DRAFT_626071 [Bimuria novae-zelandiae CBS 107.79]